MLTTINDVHRFFTEEIGLISDVNDRGSNRAYFWKAVVLAPAQTTRVARLFAGPSNEVTQIQLCVSSDNNNSVFIKPPFVRSALGECIAGEIAALEGKQAAR